MPPLACEHEPGESTAQCCAYLRALARVRAWVERAEHAQHDGDEEQPSLGELWVLFGEVQTAHDLCPDHAVARVPVAQVH